MKAAKRILVAPLNWGLGHASRCIPIIHALLERQTQVLLASDGRAGNLLEKEFPMLPLFKLPAYNIRYPGSNMIWNMAGQLHRIAWAIRQEHKAIQELIVQQQLDGIISDNRYGCYSSLIPSVCITHQLRIKMPVSLLEGPVAWFNRRQLRHFEEIWVPDYAGSPNLSGELSHDVASDRLRYLGPLSRLRSYERAQRYDVIIILSGPEPQRSLLEKELLNQAQQLPDTRFLLVQGKTESHTEMEVAKHIKVVSFLTTTALNDAIMESAMVVSRSGYSTIMDLAAMGRPAILIPTPGQTEQEYLAHHFSQQNNFVVQKQGSIQLPEALKAAAELQPIGLTKQPLLLENAIDALLERADAST